MNPYTAERQLAFYYLAKSMFTFK